MLTKGFPPTPGNIVVIGALVAAFFLYAAYQQRQGRAVANPVTGKKVN